MKVLKSMKKLSPLGLTAAAVALLWLALAVGGDAPIVLAQTGDTPTPVPTAEPDDDSGVQNLPPIEGKLNPPEYPNMNSNLNRIVQQVESGQFTARAAAANAPIHSEESVAVTFYFEEGYADALEQFLNDNGASPRNIGTDYIEAYIPVSLLPAASTQEGVISIHTIIPPQPAQGTVVSEGVLVHGATAWHAAGIKGSGVKIGVIDTGFQGFQSLMGTELPAFVEARCYTDIGAFGSSLANCGDNHGTAVTEAAFDIAPEATYYIANPISAGDVRDTVAWMVEHDVDIINMSLSWTWSGPGDGTSPYGNSVLRSVDTAVNGGATWLNSAGNDAMATWYGPFADTDADGWHNFSGEDECNQLSVELEAGKKFTAQLRWDDIWTAPESDLNLYLSLVEESDLTDVTYSEDNQAETLQPFEEVSFTPAVPGTYCLSISLQSGSRPAWIQVRSFTGQNLEYHTLHHSISEPADSANSGLLAVGAAPARDTSIIEDFSGRGPTTDNRRIKPDIVGADRVYSAAHDAAFFGTSQASPHVAGLAALVKERFPHFTPQQVATYLKNHAAERGDAGLDNTWGHGFAKLPASDAPTQPTPSPEPASTITFGDLNWDSARLQTRIAQYIAEMGYGYSTDLQFDSTSVLFQGLRAGDIDVLMELWLPNQEIVWERALAEGSVSSPGTSLGFGWQSAFVIPRYLQEQYPELDSIEDLKEERFKSLFATNETQGKARLVSCPIGWSCDYVNAKQIEGYGLSDHVYIVNPGDVASLNADLTNAYENREPWLGYQWGTNDAALLLDLVRLEEPVYSDECWETDMACAYEDATILIAVNADLPDSAADFVDALTEWDFNVEEAYKLVFRWQADNPDANTEAAATWWLLWNYELWSDWVTDDAAAAMKAALENGDIPAGWPNAPSITPEPSPEPSPEPTPTASCFEALTGSTTINGAWSEDCDSENKSGSYAQYYTFTLTEQSDVTITLESSEDTYLFLLDGHGKDGAERAQNDDHSAESDCAASLARNTDSCITETLPAGDYTIEATTYDAGATGAFTLEVTIGAATGQPPPSPTPPPVPLPPDYDIIDHACNEDDLADLEGYSLNIESGPTEYDDPGYLGVLTDYLAVWINEESDSRIICSATQYDSIKNARWDGLNYSTIVQRYGDLAHISYHEQAPRISPFIGDDMLAMWLGYQFEDEDGSFKAAEVRFLDSATRTLTRVFLRLRNSDEYPDISEPEDIARNIADRVFQAYDDQSESRSAESSGRVLEFLGRIE